MPLFIEFDAASLTSGGRATAPERLPGAVIDLRKPSGYNFSFASCSLTSARSKASGS